jgi:peptidoglycan/LPS O-acetylase OafA/YrhL
VVNEGRLPKSDQIVSSVQLAAAAAVALLVTIPVLIAPPSAELNSARYTCAFIIGVVGYGIARSAEKSRMRAALYGLAVLVLAFIIAAIKHALAGH